MPDDVDACRSLYELRSLEAGRSCSEFSSRTAFSEYDAFSEMNDRGSRRSLPACSAMTAFHSTESIYEGIDIQIYRKKRKILPLLVLIRTERQVCHEPKRTLISKRN